MLTPDLLETKLKTPFPCMISACLAGEACRYDGKEKLNHPVMDLLAKYQKPYLLFCPEQQAGMGVPRPPIRQHVANNKTIEILDKNGRNWTKQMEKSAHQCLLFAKQNQVDLVIFKEKSPSCGVKFSVFSHGVQPRPGFVARQLLAAKFLLISEEEIVSIR